VRERRLAVLRAEVATVGCVGDGTFASKLIPVRRHADPQEISGLVVAPTPGRGCNLDVPAGGWYGSATRTAVANFQRRVGLPRTGTMTVNTWRSLFYAASHGLLHGGTGSSSTFQARVLKEAAKLKGTPYRYGGTTTRGLDCSGYTGLVYKRAGKKLPRTSRQQYSATKHLSRKAAKPGDLVFFRNGGGGVYHVGIYAGGNMLWHASKPGKPVAKAKIWTSSVAFGHI